jgi:hypothetical protein
MLTEENLIVSTNCFEIFFFFLVGSRPERPVTT